MTSSIKEFTAKKFVIDTIDGIYTIAFGETADDAGQYFILQDAKPYSEQDIQQGMGSYCIMDEQGATNYGGVKKIERKGNQVVVVLNAQAADVLGYGQIDITLRSEQDAAHAEQALSNVVENS